MSIIDATTAATAGRLWRGRGRDIPTASPNHGNAIVTDRTPLPRDDGIPGRPLGSLR
ncbi:MAG: hypothetical protein VXZ35_06345 [Pseudomonadota bacterium]|nr:hypothetical protein [Pseudomonadota bacterium]